MKKENLQSRAWKELQRGMASKESLDGFAAVVGVWWAMRRAKRSEREMIDALEHMVQLNAAVAASRTAEKSSTSEARFGEANGRSPSAASYEQDCTARNEGDGLLKYLGVYALTLVLQPLLTVVLSLAALWGLWQGLLWLIFS